jgi:Cu(I)/Ag(I) efflux system membrane fusion protein
MNSKIQIALTVGLVAAAAGFVGLRLQDATPAATDAGMDGHDHAAMTAGTGTQSPVALSTEDARRIGVTFARVERRALDLAVEALGTVSYDETGLVAVNPKIEGWIEQLFVDFTGAPVRAGEPLMAVYSPMLVSAQEELVLAARLASEAGEEGRTADNARALLESARRRLAYLDIPGEEIQRIEDTGEITRTLTLRAPASGVVVEKNVIEGDRIMPGMTLYRIADLSTVWIEADVFEKDLGFVRVGQSAEVTLEALPGRSVTALVTYVYPTVSMESRTGRIRLEIANPRGELKPGMYARIALTVPAAAKTLVVPRAAVLSTGTRSLVFVEGPDGALMPREVTAGRTEGREVEILGGLQEGERIVSSAAFLVDAESNLGALTAGMGDMEADGLESDGTQMGGMEMDDGAGSAAMDASEAEPVDHSGHDMGSMTPDTTGARPDTTRTAPAGR